MKTPLLSICIATYNRAGYIGETLDSIIPQLTDEVELLVVDGASTDRTEEVVRTFVKKSSRIRYIRLANKGGVDQDYDRSVELAHGEMCWLFTDDDLLKPGAVAAVMSAIKIGHGLVVVNAEMRNRQLSFVFQRKRIEIHGDRIYAPDQMENLFIDALDYLSFIGGVVIRRSVWLSRERSAYIGTEFIHVGVIFQKPLTETSLIIAEPYITIRYGNAQWLSRNFEIWMFNWPKLVWSFENISNEAKLVVSYKEPWRKFRVLIYQRSVGNYSVQLYHEYLSTKRASVLWKFCASRISLFPKGICIGLCNVYFFLKGVPLPYPKN